MDTKDMPREDFFRVLDEIRERVNPQQVFVIVTGGEPLVREDLELCGQGIKERGFTWGTVTNGLMLTEERFDALCKAGLCSVTVSLDGMEENHNWLRGHKESFARASRAIDIILSHPEVIFDVVTCVNQRNFKELPQIRDFLISKGLTAWRLFTIFPVGRAAQDPDLQLSGSQLRELLDFIRQTRKEGVIKASFGCEGYFGNYEGDIRDHFFHCQAGQTVGSVMADGAIAACASIRSDFNQGNIYEDNFMDVWEKRYLPHRDRSWMKKGECAKCKHWRYCQGNALHLRDKDGNLILCHMKKLESA
jgi:radical SAM enzyme (rSAM/lipoprotein system)